MPVFPSTLHVINSATQRLSKGQNVLDLGTGSGAIGLAIARNHNGKVVGTDISHEAIEVAKYNAKINGIENIEFYYSDMFENINEQFDMIVSNPPCSTTESLDDLERNGKMIMPRISREGGVDGMKFHRIIANNSPRFLKENGKLILMQCYDPQAIEQTLIDSGNFDPRKFEFSYGKNNQRRAVIATPYNGIA